MSRAGFAFVALILVGFLAFLAWVTFGEPDEEGAEPARKRTAERSPRVVAPPITPLRPDPAPDEPDRPRPEPEAPKAAVITGTVVDLDGEPVAGAHVYVASAEELAIYRSAARAHSRTGEDGGFRLILEPGTLDILAYAPGYLPAIEKDVEAVAGSSPRRMRIVLDPGMTLTGSVVDTEGRPVADAWAAAFRGDAPSEPELSMKGEDSELVSYLPARGGIEIWGGRARTGDDGDFAISGLRPDPYQVVAGGFGLAMVGEPPEVAPGTTMVRITVLRLRMATGRVIAEDGEAGVPGATVRMEIRGPGVGEAQIRVTDQEGRFFVDLTDKRFAAEGLRFGLLVSVEGYENASLADLGLEDVLPGADLTVALRTAVPREPGSLRGRVVYDTGAPFVGTLTLAFSEEGKAGTVRRVVVNETGDFLLTGIPSGEYVLRTAAHASNLLRETGRVLVIPPGGEETTEFTMIRGGDVKLSIRGPGGAVPRGVSVDVLDGAGEKSSTVQVPEGRITLFDLPAGQVRLRVSGPGYRVETIEVTVEKDAATNAVVTLREAR